MSKYNNARSMPKTSIAREHLSSINRPLRSFLLHSTRNRFSQNTSYSLSYPANPSSRLDCVWFVILHSHTLIEVHVEPSLSSIITRTYSRDVPTTYAFTGTAKRPWELHGTGHTCMDLNSCQVGVSPWSHAGLVIQRRNLQLGYTYTSIRHAARDWR